MKRIANCLEIGQFFLH